MKEGTGGRKGEDGNRSATEDGRKGKIICLKNGMTGINPEAVVYGPGYCYFLLE